MRKNLISMFGISIMVACIIFSFTACSLAENEQGDLSSVVTSESAQSEISSEPASSEPSSRLSSLSNSVISNPFASSSSMTYSEMRELDADEKQKAYQLIKRFKQADISLLRYYSDEITDCTGFMPEKVKDITAIKTVTDKQQINSFVNSLRLDTWYPCKQTIKTWAHWAIYIDEDFKIGLMGGTQLRLETKDESYCFEVPVEVASVLIRDCQLVKNPDEQTTARLIEELKQKKVSVLRYYEKSINNPLIFYPLDEFEGSQYFGYVTDSEKIEQFMELLRFDEWKSGDMRLNGGPIYHVYFDEDTYLSVEGSSDDYYWVSLHTKEVSARYIVPRDVWRELEEHIRAQIYPKR